MILTAKYTDIGGRGINEDSAGIYVKEGCVCAVVADGVGGHGGGDKASRYAAAMINSHYKNSDTPFPKQQVQGWFQQINDDVCSHQTKECKMRTTLSVLFADNQKCFWAYVGDSRIYHFADKRLAGMTVDHSVSQMAVFSGEITQAQVRHHADRNKLIRSIGNDSAVKVDVSDYFDVGMGEHAFLLCTDGFWEYVLEDEMEQALRDSDNPVKWLDKMSAIIKSRVPENNDNNTAVAVWIKNN